MALVFQPKKKVKTTIDPRSQWKFDDGTMFRIAKQQVVEEVRETMHLLGMTQHQLAVKLGANDSAVAQYLELDRGIQLATLVRMADALNCDVEVNFIKRLHIDLAEAVDEDTLAHGVME